MTKQTMVSTSEAANLLGISRIAVFKKIKSGKLKATKIGRNYIIESEEIEHILGSALNKQTKSSIDKAVQKAIDEYGETLRLLGKE